MTPRDFLATYDPDALHQINHAACAGASLPVAGGDVVGVLLLERGGPTHIEDVPSFLYRLLMDPIAVDIPVGGRLRHWLCRSLARLHARTLRDKYRKIGDSSPANRLVREQAHALESVLNERSDCTPSGALFRVYPGLRHGSPSMETTVHEMIRDGVDRVVVLPLHPHYSDATTGAMVAYWTALHDAGERPNWPMTTVCAYATNPKYIRALSERIDEGLQRFPSTKRDDVHLVFSTLGMPDVVPNALRGQAPVGSRHHVKPTVDAIMEERTNKRPYHVAFERHSRWSDGTAPALANTLESLVRDGTRTVLVVPIAFVTDHVETMCELDIEMRDYADTLGITHYEVTSSLNSHPLFIDALADVTTAHLDLSANTPNDFEGDGVPEDELPVPSPNVSASRHDSSSR